MEMKPGALRSCATSKNQLQEGNYILFLLEKQEFSRAGLLENLTGSGGRSR
jgi:hypothetical protein